MIPDGWSVAWESEDRRACSDRALVLTSLAIPHELLGGQGTWAIVVPDAELHRARHELWLYARENEPLPRRRAVPVTANHNPYPGVAGYVIVICLVAWLAGEGAFGRDWLTAGRVDGALIRDGEWWRTITALTLHKDIGHLLGNLVFGALFGLLAARVIGSGVTWLTVVVTAAFANALNTAVLIPAHRSIGASTAVFAALGLVAGFVWRGRLMAQDRWPYRLGPIVGGIALLAYTGTGDESTDIGAHLAGFVCGFGGGILLTRAAAVFEAARLQWICGTLAPVLIGGAWLLALR
ncbi:MAG: rhomboid family intramembrane serine protease [Woeseiaceae bacterium]|nr:rhomboid family intramembrane serine protease [Woeseiaceae bacterium]